MERSITSFADTVACPASPVACRAFHCAHVRTLALVRAFSLCDEYGMMARCHLHNTTEASPSRDHRPGRGYGMPNAGRGTGDTRTRGDRVRRPRSTTRVVRSRVAAPALVRVVGAGTWRSCQPLGYGASAAPAGAGAYYEYMGRGRTSRVWPSSLWRACRCRWPRTTWPWRQASAAATSVSQAQKPPHSDPSSHTVRHTVSPYCHLASGSHCACRTVWDDGSLWGVSVLCEKSAIIRNRPP